MERQQILQQNNTNHGKTTNISKKVLIMERQHILQNHTIPTSDDTNHE